MLPAGVALQLADGRLATGSNDVDGDNWNVAANTPQLTLGHTGPVNGAIFSADGNQTFEE